MDKSALDPLSLPDVRSWAKSFDGPMSLLDYATHNVSIDTMYAITSLFWPRFIQVKGCILLPWSYDESVFDKWWTKCGGRITDIEAVLNHLHLWDVFRSKNTDLPEIMQAYKEVGQKLSNAWRDQLAAMFPGTDFNVYYADDEREYGPTVGFRRVERE